MGAELLQSTRVAPSILSADYSRLGAQVEEVMAAGARVIHVDVMDGHFVPRITIGALVVESLKEQVAAAGGWLDVHLMIDRPERHIEQFASAGADSISVHAEATPHVHFAIDAVRGAGCAPGLAINPATPAGDFDDVVGMIDVLLCMTVNPGWGGQAFIPTSVAKIERLRSRLPSGIAIEVDGGIDAETAPKCANAGASLFVAGSAVFGAEDPAQAYTELARSIGAA